MVLDNHTSQLEFEYPIDGTLDLHQFLPNETRDVVWDYLDACVERGISQVRIVHGKGIGVQRRIVQKVLRRHPAVIRFFHEGGSGGGWGATIALLRVSEQSPTP